MKRLGRWLFNGLAAMSLLLLVTTAALWVRSYRVSDHWYFQNDRNVNGNTRLFDVKAFCAKGTLEFDTESGIATDVSPDERMFRYQNIPTAMLMFQGIVGTGIERLGFRF